MSLLKYLIIVIDNITFEAQRSTNTDKTILTRASLNEISIKSKYISWSHD